MINFIDKTSEQDGTPINRKNMMGIQGFKNETYSLLGNITEISGENDSDKVIIYPMNYGTKTQTIEFISDIGTEKEKTITMTLKINGDGTLTKEIS